MSCKTSKELKKIVKHAIKLCVFIILASLPFITVTQIIGLDIFLDSFENPEYYLCLQDKGNLFGVNIKNGEYVITQKSSHPEFNIKKSDTIIYSKNDGNIECNKVYCVYNTGAIKRYQTTEENDIINKPIYESQIIGKVINVIDDNIWNSISIKIWETSIQNLNLRALLADN